MKKQFSRRLDEDIIKTLKSFAKAERKSDTQVVGDALRSYLREKGFWPPDKNV